MVSNMASLVVPMAFVSGRSSILVCLNMSAVLDTEKRLSHGKKRNSMSVKTLLLMQSCKLTSVQKDSDGEKSSIEFYTW